MSAFFLPRRIGDFDTGGPGAASDAAISRTMMTGRMRRVCMYCHSCYGTKPCDAAMDGATTHGACAVCAQRVLDVLAVEISDQRKD